MKKCLGLLFLSLVASVATAIDPGTVYVPPSCQGGVFNDVICPGQYADWVEEIFNEGILVGCGSGNYCPTEPLTREQAAVAILRAEHRRSILTGIGTCGAGTKAVNWAICSGTVADPEIQVGMIIVGTYQTRNSDTQIPIRIFNIVAGSFDFEIQTGTSFMWMAAPIIPNPNLR
ncbi:MAG: hypothetical protein ABI968_12815 [Acidobacteriota bacterium]